MLYNHFTLKALFYIYSLKHGRLKQTLYLVLFFGFFTRYCLLTLMGTVTATTHTYLHARTHTDDKHSPRSLLGTPENLKWGASGDLTDVWGDCWIEHFWNCSSLLISAHSNDFYSLLLCGDERGQKRMARLGGADRRTAVTLITTLHNCGEQESIRMNNMSNLCGGWFY